MLLTLLLDWMFYIFQGNVVHKGPLVSSAAGNFILKAVIQGKWQVSFACSSVVLLVKAVAYLGALLSSPSRGVSSRYDKYIREKCWAKSSSFFCKNTFSLWTWNNHSTHVLCTNNTVLKRLCSNISFAMGTYGANLSIISSWYSQ